MLFELLAGIQNLLRVISRIWAKREDELAAFAGRFGLQAAEVKHVRQYPVLDGRNVFQIGEAKLTTLFIKQADLQNLGQAIASQDPAVTPIDFVGNRQKYSGHD